MLDDWLELGNVNAWQRLDHPERLVVVSLSLGDLLARRRMVLVVAQQNMVQEWAVGRQEPDSNFKGLTVPEF